MWLQKLGADVARTQGTGGWQPTLSNPDDQSAEPPQPSAAL